MNEHTNLEDNTMKTLNMFGAFLLAFAIIAFAGNVEHKHGANVYKVDSDGKEYAVCACGQKMEVDKNTAKAEYKGSTYYFCGPGCKANFDKSTEKVIGAFEVQVGKAKAEEGLLGNVYKVDDEGNKMAKCGCGMDVKVDDNTVSRTHENHTYYLCSNQCAGMFDKKPDKVIGAIDKAIKSTKGTKSK